MSLPQENFEAAVAEAADTFALLEEVPQLSGESEAVLRRWLWDVEAVAAAIRSELVTRGGLPIDFG